MRGLTEEPPPQGGGSSAQSDDELERPEKFPKARMSQLLTSVRWCASVRAGAPVMTREPRGPGPRLIGYRPGRSPRRRNRVRRPPNGVRNRPVYAAWNWPLAGLSHGHGQVANLERSHCPGGCHGSHLPTAAWPGGNRYRCHPVLQCSGNGTNRQDSDAPKGRQIVCRW